MSNVENYIYHNHLLGIVSKMTERTIMINPYLSNMTERRIAIYEAVKTEIVNKKPQCFNSDFIKRIAVKNGLKSNEKELVKNFIDMLKFEKVIKKISYENGKNIYDFLE